MTMRGLAAFSLCTQSAARQRTSQLFPHWTVTGAPPVNHLIEYREQLVYVTRTSLLSSPRAGWRRVSQTSRRRTRQQSSASRSVRRRYVAGPLSKIFASSKDTLANDESCLRSSLKASCLCKTRAIERRPSRDTPEAPPLHGRASNTRLNGVSVVRGFSRSPKTRNRI
jgi:hypothetical protein